MLTDTEIAKLIESGILMGADATRIGPVSYDLSNYRFYQDGQELEEAALKPGDSVFVGACETI